MRGQSPCLPAPSTFGADSTWAAASDSDSEASESEREVEAGPHKHAQLAKPRNLPTAIALDACSSSDGSAGSDTSDAEEDAGLSLVKPGILPSMQNMINSCSNFQPPPRKAAAQPPALPLGTTRDQKLFQPLPPEAAPRNPLGLASYLREENNRIREAIVQAQREAEAAVMSSQEAKPIDFAHLLALAKDFGEGLGSIAISDEITELQCAVTDSHGDGVEGAISISTPRGHKSAAAEALKSDVSSGEPDSTHKRAELARLRTEVCSLRAKLAESEAEAEYLRRQLGAMSGAL